MAADLDVCELHMTIKDFFTQRPYVDSSSGLTTLDMPYESIEVTDVMFEPGAGDISTAKITLPSLIAQPGLRSLYQKIKEGNRVELFNFQPDCGDPVFAGFIPPEGIEEQDGKTILNVEDTLGQLKYQHLRRFESPISANASGLYDRARSIWVDLLNEDFSTANTSSFYSQYLFAPNPTVTWGQGFVQITGTNSAGQVFIYPTTGPASSFVISPGDTFLIETDVTLNNLFATPWPKYTEVALCLIQTGNPPGNVPQVDAILVFQNSSNGTYPYEEWSYPLVISGGIIRGATSAFGGTNLATPIQMPATRHLAMYVRFDGPTQTVNVQVYVNNINVASTVQPWTFDSTTYQPQLFGASPSASEYIQVTSWRVSRLAPALLRAARFNPQTTDNVSQQVNGEENLQFLQLVAEKDGAEYRPIYHAWPQTDELELDDAGTLGTLASRALGYEQPANLPLVGSPESSPFPSIIDAASFLTTPPFRFEEGYNLDSPPRVLPRANAHANDVIRVGASSIDSQVFGEKWLTSELGAPQKGILGTYPRFEQITNDDRVGNQSLVASLASLELARRTDGTPSIEVSVVDELPWAFRWRSGDQILLKTLSLRNNVEQEMRVQRMQYRAGSPLRTVTMGHVDQDPSMLRLLAEDTKMQWLYEQSGSNPGIYTHPSPGNILAGATGPTMTIPLDQYTTGSALVYAALHWFADANVLKLQPIINGIAFDLTGITAASGTDSGLIICTNFFQGPGTYTLAFKNNDSSTRNLTNAYLVLRIRGG